MRSMDVRVKGAADLRRTAGRIRAESKKLPKGLRSAISKTMSGLPEEIRKETRILPSGYTPTMRKALKFAKVVRLAQNPEVSLTVRAIGRTQERDVASINRGVLRHPLYGNRHHWYGQPVQPDFVTGPFRRNAPKIRRAVEQVLDDMGRAILRA